MNTFAELKYERPDMEEAKASTRQRIEKMRQAASYEEMRELYMEQKDMESQLETMYTVAHIRNTVNTADPFYAEETAYFHRENPQLELLTKEVEKLILDSPYRDGFAEEFGTFFVKNMEMRQALSDASIVENLIAESELTQQYSKISASASTEFRGQSCNFYGLLKHMQSTDRAERKEAMMAWGDLYEKISEELDQVYDKLVALRASMAKKLGFDSYITFAYVNRGRYDYNAQDVARFRSQVRQVIVPLCEKLRRQQAERLSVEKLYYYDEMIQFPQGNPAPQGTMEEQVDKALAMYEELSAETGEFFRFMKEHQLFDLETKPGKRTGGYCTFLNTYGAPFIFSNFNGTDADVEVLTHEAGHAFEAYVASPRMRFSDMIFSTSEIDEIHSISMEYFTYPWMELFFGDRADDYRKGHIIDSLESVAYITAVDEFQHRIFADLTLDAKGRRAVWKELEKTYLPWRDYDGHGFLEEGGFWMQKQHIFLFPFYYIDYALAQMGAFEFYGRMKENRQKAWADYYKLCQSGGSLGYFDTLKVPGLRNPFEEGTVKAIVESLEEEVFD